MSHTHLARVVRLLCFAMGLNGTIVACGAPVDFRREVWPILQTRCLACHGPDKQKSSFRIDSPAALLKGGDHGAAVVAGAPDESPLLGRVLSNDSELRMPPEGERLTAEQIDTLRRWIREGANWPAEFTPTRADPPHWAFQPVRQPAVPESTSQALVGQNPIDAFVIDKLAERELTLSPPADPRTLIRRVTLDLTGLPPTPAEVEAFLAATTVDGRVTRVSEEAWESVLDRLLASPRYGERWAQHWLDVIRYADTTGYEANSVRPNAWPYRDYVIRALNADISYPTFILEQLAGDTLGIDPATGFLVTAPFPSRIEIGQEAAAIAQTRYNGLDEVAQNIGSAILGMTVGCARCHDHKFDPISTRDYYRLVTCFAGLQFVERSWLAGSLPSNELRTAEQRLNEVREELKTLPAWRETEPISTADYFQPVTVKWVRLTVKGTYVGQPYAPAIDELEVWTPGSDGEPPRNVGAAEASAIARSSGPDRSLGARDEFLNDGQLGRKSRWVSKGRLDKVQAWVEIELPEPTLIHQVRWSCDHDDQGDDLVAAKWRTLKRWVVEVAQKPGEWREVVSADRKQGPEPERKRRDTLEKQFTQAARHLWELTHVFAGRFRDPDPGFVLRRGDPQQWIEGVGAGGIDVLGGYELPLDAPESERRVALATWLGSETNPLTARVLVNRVWRHHFGTGLVDTPSDFGTQGERPTHPELLDWLTCEFMARGWKLKELHKMICRSAAYRQASQPHAAGCQADPDSRLLWRFPPRRLDADAIRDAILFVSESLDLTMGGPGVSVYRPQSKPDSGEWVPEELPGPETWRRTIYLLRARAADDGLFKPFDLPDCGQVRAKRTTSTTPLQALNLFNSPWILEQSRKLAGRAEREGGADLGRQVDRVFALTFGRAPSDPERDKCVAVAGQHGLWTVCRVLFNSNEFLQLE